MSEGKLLIFSVGVILFLGIIFLGVSESFEVEENLNDTWVTTAQIDTISGSIIDLTKYVVTTPVWITETITNFFGVDNTDDSSIVIEGTGIYENITLDGEYVQISDNDFENKVKRKFLFFWDLSRIETDSTGNITGANITTNFLDEDPIYEAININTGNWYDEWNLVATNTTFNPTITAEGSSAYLNPPISSTEKVITFFENIKSNVTNSIKTFGLIPDVIGYPIFILLIIGIIYAIIKLLPWT